MSSVYLSGSRDNLVALLRLIASEVEGGERVSRTNFCETPGWDPEHSLHVIAVDEQPHDTTMEVRS